VDVMQLINRTFAASAVAVILQSGFALACEPEPQTPSNRLVRLDNCAAEIQYSEYSYARISEAEDLGNGFVLQYLIDGSACDPSEVDDVVQDCNSGRAAIFGGVRGAFMTIEPDGKPAASEVLLERIRATTSKGKPMSIDQILASAKNAKIPYVLEAETRSTLAINGHKFRLGCGCRTFYPDLPGAGG
jgi:hypothetical protein